MRTYTKNRCEMFMKSGRIFLPSCLVYLIIIVCMDFTSFAEAEDTTISPDVNETSSAPPDAVDINKEFMKAKKKHFTLSYEEPCDPIAEQKLNDIKAIYRNVNLNTSSPVNSQPVLDYLRELENSTVMFCNYSVSLLVCNAVTKKCECPERLQWRKKWQTCDANYSLDYTIKNFSRNAYFEYQELSKIMLPLDFNETCSYAVDSALMTLRYQYERYVNQRFIPFEDPVAVFNGLYASVRSIWVLTLAERIQPCDLGQGLKCSGKSGRCRCSTAEWHHKFVRRGGECRVKKLNYCTPAETTDDAYFTAVKYLPAIYKCDEGLNCMSTVINARTSCVSYRPNRINKSVRYRICKCR